MTARAIYAIALLALALVAPASADPVFQLGDLPVSSDPPQDPRTSCAVTSLDAPGSGVTPFADAAALGARVGTAAGSVTLAVYPFSCSHIVFQVADPNQRIPREPLPEDTPLYGSVAPVYHLILP